MGKKSRVVGGALLIAGTCIGAGMLALPISTGPAGYFPAAVALFISWFFMMTTGLLLLEVNLWLGKGVSIVSMAEKTLGRPGKWVAWLVYLFLFYSLMVAYLSGGGILFCDLLENLGFVALPPWLGSVLLLVLFSTFVFRGTKSVDGINRYLMGGLILTYVCLLLKGTAHVQEEYLLRANWELCLYTLPIFIIAFGYHNMIPSLVGYLEENVRALRWAIIGGSFIPLLVYLIWEMMVLGLVPLEGEAGLLAAFQSGIAVTHVLKGAVGGTWVLTLMESFAFFAMLTSFLGVALSFVDFLADGLQWEQSSKKRFVLCSLVFCPPFIFSLFYSHIFIQALSYAGGFGAVILFGILPSAMVYAGTRWQKRKLKWSFLGHPIVLTALIAFSLAVMGLEFLHEMGWSSLAKILKEGVK